jgi:hypothetical protein
MAHFNSSHGEKSSLLIDSPGKIQNANFWGRLEGAQRVYIPVLSPRPERPFAAQDCRIIAGFTPKLTQTETAQRMKMPSFSRLHSSPHIPAPPPFPNRM